ncbi:MAG: uracil-DNA glycosylase [Puniceicoccales bacterium]|jgi:DNA polymerase|nr:uracil-DNA glycosylase [Puniceicoccales bacterium]
MNEVIYYTIKALEAMQQRGQEDISIGDENVKFLLSLISDGDSASSSEIIPSDEIPQVVAKKPLVIDPADEIKPQPENSIHSSNSEIIPSDEIPQVVVEEPLVIDPADEIKPQPKNSISLPDGNKSEQWLWLRNKVLTCPVCNENLNPGKKIVFGVGNLDADIFLCGEAPGADEEIAGEPFVGRAGQLLTKIITAMGLTRSDVYIGNIMNWRPKMPTEFGNRPPTKEEMQFCLPYLCAQLQIVKPKVILTLGTTALNGLLGHDSTRKMTDIRGKWLEFNGIKLMPTFHPSYVLRNNSTKTKRMIWEDFMKVMEFLDLPLSDKQRKFFT